MTNNEYTCEKCQGTFIKGWSDEEAKAELDRNFPGMEIENCAMICDDCYVVPMSFEQIKAKARKDMTDVYRKMRKDSPAIARLYWRMNKEVEKKMIDIMLYGTSYSSFSIGGEVKHIPLKDVYLDQT